MSEYLGGPSGYAVASDPASAVRLWFAMTLRQTCLFIISGLTLLQAADLVTLLKVRDKTCPALSVVAC